MTCEYTTPPPLPPPHPAALLACCGLYCHISFRAFEPVAPAKGSPFHCRPCERMPQKRTRMLQLHETSLRCSPHLLATMRGWSRAAAETLRGLPRHEPGPPRAGPPSCMMIMVEERGRLPAWYTCGTYVHQHARQGLAVHLQRGPRPGDIRRALRLRLQKLLKRSPHGGRGEGCASRALLAWTPGSVRQALWVEPGDVCYGRRSGALQQEHLSKDRPAETSSSVGGVLRGKLWQPLRCPGGKGRSQSHVRPHEGSHCPGCVGNALHIRLPKPRAGVEGLSARRRAARCKAS